MSKLEVNALPKSAKLLIDGEPLKRGYCINYLDLLRSGLFDGEYFFLTCGCGEPGCAGLFEPMEVTSDDKRVYWHVVQPEPERWFTFNKKEYIKVLKSLFPQLLSIREPTAGRMGFNKGFYKSLHELQPLFDSQLA